MAEWANLGDTAQLSVSFISPDGVLIDPSNEFLLRIRPPAGPELFSVYPSAPDQTGPEISRLGTGSYEFGLNFTQPGEWFAHLRLSVEGPQGGPLFPAAWEHQFNVSGSRFYP